MQISGKFKKRECYFDLNPLFSKTVAQSASFMFWKKSTSPIILHSESVSHIKNYLSNGLETLELAIASFYRINFAQNT